MQKTGLMYVISSADVYHVKLMVFLLNFTFVFLKAFRFDLKNKKILQ